jgi:hypothetical protein
MRVVGMFGSFVLPLFLCAPVALAQADPGEAAPSGALSVSAAACGEAPSEDALVSTCAPPSTPQEERVTDKVPEPSASIGLGLPAGTPLRIALDQRLRINHPGEPVHGKVVETVYAFDQAVVPAGSIATGHVAAVDPVSVPKRAMAYSNGNFSPFHKYKVTFDKLTLPDGKQVAIKTTVSPGTAQVVRLVSNPEKEKQKGIAGRAEDKTKEEAKGKIQEAKDEVHDAWQQVMAPGKMQRLKQHLLAQSPYRRQYLEPGTRFVADVDEAIDFGETTRTGTQLAEVGTAPAEDSTLKARLSAEVSSATATRGTPVTAVLTEPLYSPAHVLILPANTRLIGEVVQAKPARKLHHNGELRVLFERMETPDEAVQALAQVQAPVSAPMEHTRAHSPAQSPAQSQVQSQAQSQAMIGNLESIEVDRNANIKLDEEGGARTTDSKTRYLSTGIAVLLAAAAAHPDGDADHGGAVDAGGDPGVRTAAGGSGFRLTGAILSLAAKSTPLSIAFGTYGASASIYSNFLSRGHDVVLPKDTPLEIGFGAPHPTKEKQPGK